MLPAMPNAFNCVPQAGYGTRPWIATQFSPSANRKREGDSMKFRPWSFVVAVTLFTTLEMLGGVTAQNATAQETTTKHHHYKLFDVGTFGGNLSLFSNPGSVVLNNRGLGAFGNAPQAACQVLETGLFPCSSFTFSSNALFSPTTTETRAFLWQNGVMRDLGTLGGPDGSALINNNHGEVAGWSYTSFVANPSTGVPSVDPFLWSPEDGKMTYLGSLGGTFGAPFFLNNRGQVVGVSNLAGDVVIHPFIWSKSEGMKDLGTLGGTYGHPDWIHDAGAVVGFSKIAGVQNGGQAFFLRPRVMTG